MAVALPNAGRRSVLAWTATFVLALVLPAAAQVTSAQSAQAAPSAPEPVDPLGRDTPRGTIAGFNFSAHREDFVSAARYLQVTRAQRANTEQLARDLVELIDRYYLDPIANVSDAREGALDDGLPPDRERVVLTIDGEPVDIELVQVKEPSGLVWLVSSQTLTRVPSLRRSAGVTWLESIMPNALVSATLFGVSLAQWVALAATLAIPLGALWLLSRICITLSRRTIAGSARRDLLEVWCAGLRWPAILVIALVAHLASIPLLGLSLRFRLIYSRFGLFAAVLAAAWLFWRLMALSFAHARIRAQRRGHASLRSLLLLAERVSKTVVILMTVFAVLTIAGVDTTTALAGVGIGGVAVALGAQKSVENLLGGVFLLTDRALAVGDLCSISNRLGVVEDITMRSVRLRTIEQTLLSVPAGVLSQSSVENFATRNKILVQSTLRLRYGTSADQLRRVLSGIRALLDRDPDIERESSRIRLVDFGERAIELELFAYVLTPDLLTFLAVREALLLQIASTVEASGTSFAKPTLVYGEPTAAIAHVDAHAASSLNAVATRGDVQQGRTS